MDDKPEVTKKRSAQREGPGPGEETVMPLMGTYPVPSPILGIGDPHGKVSIRAKEQRASPEPEAH